MEFAILNRKQAKAVLARIQEQWGSSFSDDSKDYVFLQSKEKIYIANKELFALDFSKIRMNSLGIYFAELKNDELRLSIEGSQLIGKTASKNILELDKRQAREWLKGHDMEISSNAAGFQLIKHGNDFMGTGKLKGSMLLNFVPKTRRLNVSD